MAFARFFAPLGTAQQSRLESPCAQLIATGTPAFCNGAMRPFQTLATQTALSVSICGGTAPVSHHFTTSFLILSKLAKALSTSSGYSLAGGTPAASSANSSSGLLPLPAPSSVRSPGNFLVSQKSAQPLGTAPLNAS